MSKLTRAALGVLVVVVALGFTHAWLNLGFDPLRAVGLAEAGGREETFKVGFLPVTCHLTCPVTDFINKNMAGKGFFEPVRFNGWPELKEALISGRPAGDLHPGARWRWRCASRGCRSRSSTSATATARP